MIQSLMIFLGSMVAVWLAGRTLTRTCDTLAERTRMGRVFVGSILLAGATSLPEAAASVSAGTMGYADIALGNVFGSNLFNMAILGICGIVWGGKSMLQAASQSQVPAAVLGMILSTLACLGLLAGETTGLFHVGVWTLAIPAVYLLWIYLLRVRARVDLKLPPIGVETMEVDSRGTGRLWLLFAASALLLIAAASLLSYSAKTIADLSGLGETVIGTTLVALVTSAPELITCLAAIRIGSVDLAVGNALGSNIFNMNILFFADIAYRRSPILTAASPIHSKTALVGIFLSGLVALGMVTPIPGRIGRFTVESILLLLAYMGFSAYLLTQV